MLPSAIIIRAATPADAAAILRVHRQSILGLGIGTYSRAEAESWAAGLTAERYVQAMNGGGETFIVAVAAGSDLAGFCSFKDDSVIGLYVAPEWARRGIGSALLQRAEAVIAGAGHRRICLDAALSGQAFYERHGYRVTERRGGETRGGLVIPWSTWTRIWVPSDLRSSGLPSTENNAYNAYIAHMRFAKEGRMNSATLSFRVDIDKARRLDELATATARPKSWLLEQALDAYLETQAWQVAHIEKGLKELDRGEGVPHAEVAPWLKSWGRKPSRKRRR
jgi:putative acetyltransferase